MKRKNGGASGSFEYKARRAMSADRKRKMQLEADEAEMMDDHEALLEDMAREGCSCRFCLDAVRAEWNIDNG